jgi:hypothetical protein
LGSRTEKERNGKGKEGRRESKQGRKGGREKAYLLIRIHTSEAARMAGLAALGGNVLHLFLWAVGEVSGVGVVGHFVLVVVVLLGLWELKNGAE